MALTLGLTGMDPDTETELKAAFAEADARLGGHWQLVPEAEADHVVVDMDSMYGPMSWLRLHAAGKNVIGLSSAPRTQTEFRLGRPFDSHQVSTLLQHIARHEGDVGLSPRSPPAPGDAAAPSAEAAPTPSAEVVRKETGSAQAPHAGPTGVEVTATATAGMTPAPAPQDQLPEETVNAGQAAVPPPEPDPVPSPPEPPRDPVLADWLVPHALTHRVRYRRGAGPALLIDPTAGIWHGPALLKPIAGYCTGTVRSEDFDPLDDAQWAGESAAAGAAQPLSRLHWLAALHAGQGALLPGHDPAGRYLLTRWPQTEREYPRHFRIATAMMKGPATVAEIAEAGDMPAADVADFINASLATGYAEFVPEPPPAPIEPPKPGGLFGRLRNR